MKIIIHLENETVDDLKLAIKKIQEEISKRNLVFSDSSVKNKSTTQNNDINLTKMLLKNKESMLKNPLKKD